MDNILWQEILSRIDAVLTLIVPESVRDPDTWYPIELIQEMKEYTKKHEGEQLYSQVHVTYRIVLDQFDYNARYSNEVFELLGYIKIVIRREIMLPRWD
jgi:hypothetical protein